MTVMLSAHLRDFVVNDRRIRVDEKSGIRGMRLDLLNVFARHGSYGIH